MALPLGHTIPAKSASICLLNHVQPVHGLPLLSHSGKASNLFTSSFSTCRSLPRSKRDSDIKLSSNSIKECFEILELPDSCNDTNELRTSFIRLAKLYHPDGKMPTSDAEKFARVENSYRTLREKMMRDASTKAFLADVDQQENEYDIRHTAPQHRQYLSYDGVGSGTMSQRQRQYQSDRVDRAVESVHEHRTMKIAAQNENSLIYMDKKAAQTHKIRSAIDRLVEDLIQESMAKGDFDNLPGKGKPLKHTAHNPYIDSVTQKLNEVLINNGFTPEWILLEKEIRNEVSSLRSRLKLILFDCDKHASSDAQERNGRSCRTNELRQDVTNLNRKIDKYNFLVPQLEKQRIHFMLDKEVEKVLKESESKKGFDPKRPTDVDNQIQNRRDRAGADLGANNNGSLLDLFFYLFRS